VGSHLVPPRTTDFRLLDRSASLTCHASSAKPGDGIVDIGGGWGAFVEYAGQRGIRVTSLMISEPSRRLIQT
jgi:cyclopropane-fatty-acyl-phospholipid synthase